MKLKIMNDLSIFFDNIIPERYLSKLQEFLLSGAIFTEASKVLSILVIFILIREIALAITLTILSLPLSMLILPLFVIPGLFTYVIVQQERRAREIEKTAPDFLRQLSSMLRVGLSFENAMEDMSQYGEGPLYDIMKLWSGLSQNILLIFSYIKSFILMYYVRIVLYNVIRYYLH
ncbi:hypothetical protein [Methanobrevibacter sp.]|uniref:hypothetical protein n=1 Tax=Methanobrevibacter sp. TaxID=66852 RepID=UPI003866C169